jgi:exopolysaccharide biosynthesis protein
LSVLSGLAAPMADAETPDSVWDRIDDGLEHAQFPVPPMSEPGNSYIDVVRIDPRVYAVNVKMASQTESGNLTLDQWCARYNLLAATNAGMFLGDHRTHVGYLEHGGHVNSATNAKAYKSAAAFDPVDSTAPYFRIFDLDSLTLDSVKSQYRTVIQNLRLIKRPGKNVWSQQDKRWSEAALGEDARGNILFIFSRSAYSMHDLNDILLGLPIDLVAAQHLEGGPEAALFLAHNGQRIQKAGSFETGFMTSDSNHVLWPLPNVIGIEKRRD